MALKSDGRKVVGMDEETGNIADVLTYRKGRRCKLCKTPLTIYTPGPCCNVHQHKWAMLEVVKEAELKAKKETAELHRSGVQVTNWYSSKKKFSHCYENLKSIKLRAKKRIDAKRGTVFALFRYS